MNIKRIIKPLCSCFIAWSTNRRIKKQIEAKQWEDLFNEWEKRIAPTGAQSMDWKKMKLVEKAVDDLYQSEIKRREIIESKATSLFEAMGFAVALISVAITFAEKSPLLIISLLPIANLILSGICSWNATKIGEFFLPTLQSVKDNLELAKEKLITRPIAEKLADIEINSPILLIKSNWLFAAYQHFLIGILLIAIFFTIIILGILGIIL